MDKSPATASRLKQLVPRPVKRAVKQALLDRKFRRALQKISNLREGEAPSRELLTELQTGWGNESFAAAYDYLEEVIHRASITTGPILECGSGLTSVLLGLIAGRRGVETWSLEHTPEWHARLERILLKERIPGVHLCFAPLREYDGFSWYDPPLATLPNNFSLVVCDGPPGTTPGGRYGLMPLLSNHLVPEALILLDDANRAGEAQTLVRWIAEKNVRTEMRETPTGCFALVTYNQA
ncbi:MAG: hypothetical protein ACR2HX_12140 [Pyrinomonadaceae bacterium]